MTRAIVTAFHKYTPFGSEIYEPLFNFFFKNLAKYNDEFDKVYFIDSTWNSAGFSDIAKLGITQIGSEPQKINVEFIKVNPSLRYYDAYKEVLSMVQEDLVLFMDNDTVVYREGIIKSTFELLDPSEDFKKYWSDLSANHDATLGPIPSYDVVTIIDQIGEYKTSRLKNGNKFCPYWFATKKDLLIQYTDIDWGPNMPHSETLGKLTEAMLEDGVKVYEVEDDKSNILFDGTKNPEKGKNLGYMHIRSGSVPAYLLATKHYGNLETYWKYIKEQPQSEYLRQAFWYQWMGGDPSEIVSDIDITPEKWDNYYKKAIIYYGLYETD